MKLHENDFILLRNGQRARITIKIDNDLYEVEIENNEYEENNETLTIHKDEIIEKF